MGSKEEETNRKIIHYYRNWESRLGYRFLCRSTRHFGYYPTGKKGITMRLAQRLMEDKLAQKLNLPKNSLVLDAGCGEGNVAIFLATQYRLKIIGVDLINFMIKNANRKTLRLNLQGKIRFQQMDYSNLAFDSNFFDGIYTLETLVHSSNYLKTLKEFHRVLKPNGTLVLFEYSISPWKNFPSKLIKIGELIIKESGMASLPHFLHGKFPKILKEAGFKKISVEAITPRVMPMLKRFYQIAFIPYQFIKLFGLQGKFINATVAFEGFRIFSRTDFWRYNLVTAFK